MMRGDKVEIRPLAIEDVSRVVRLHQSAFPSFFLTGLGARFLRTYYERFPSEASAIALVAADLATGELAGFVVGSMNSRGFYRRLLRHHWIRFALAAIPGVLRRPRIVRRVARAMRYPGTTPVGADVVGLFSIAVAPEAQGRSIGRRLVDEFVERSRHRGGTEIYLTTDADGNDATNAFYRSRGFDCRRTYTTAEGRRMNEYWLTLATIHSDAARV
jgi:ribosomal protein S18 acetylase RimI-like enzyme